MRTTLTFAPLDFEPVGPMLAMRAVFAMGDSEATYASTEEDCADAPIASAVHNRSTENSIVVDVVELEESKLRSEPTATRACAEPHAAFAPINVLLQCMSQTNVRAVDADDTRKCACGGRNGSHGQSRRRNT